MASHPFHINAKTFEVNCFWATSTFPQVVSFLKCIHSLDCMRCKFIWLEGSIRRLCLMVILTMRGYKWFSTLMSCSRADTQPTNQHNFSFLIHNQLAWRQLFCRHQRRLDEQGNWRNHYYRKMFSLFYYNLCILESSSRVSIIHKCSYSLCLFG